MNEYQKNAVLTNCYPKKTMLHDLVLGLCSEAGNYKGEKMTVREIMMDEQERRLLISVTDKESGKVASFFAVKVVHWVDFSAIYLRCGEYSLTKILNEVEVARLEYTDGLAGLTLDTDMYDVIVECKKCTEYSFCKSQEKDSTECPLGWE